MQTKRQQIDTLLSGLDRADSPGASVLVIRRGRAYYRRSFGLANAEEKIAATPDTNYRLASVTKQFTAMAIMILAEQRRLRIDDSITKHLPELPGYAGPVTIRHLLTHTSGLVDYEDLIPAGTTAQLKDSDVLALLAKQDKTYFPPGSAYRYSNSGYALLALIVEKVSGLRFADYLRKKIFAPLRMSLTVAFEDGVSEVKNRAFGYSNRGNRFERTDQSLTSAVLGDGGVYSSLSDLRKWDSALYGARLVRLKTMRTIFKPHTSTDRDGVSYGFGWRIEGEGKDRILWHSGETIGFRNAIFRMPGRRISVIVLSNRNDTKAPDLAREVLRVMAER